MTSAVRVPPVMMAISPTKSPGPRVANTAYVPSGRFAEYRIACFDRTPLHHRAEHRGFCCRELAEEVAPAQPLTCLDEDKPVAHRHFRLSQHAGLVQRRNATGRHKTARRDRGAVPQ